MCSVLKTDWQQVHECEIGGKFKVVCFVVNPKSRMIIYILRVYTLLHWLKMVGTLMTSAASPYWNNHSSILLRLAFQISVYYIWLERDERKAQAAVTCRGSACTPC